MAGDNHILDELRAGGREAFAKWFAFYRPRLERLVVRRLSGRLKARVDPADVLQEIFIKAMKRLTSYLEKPLVSFSVWLHGIAIDTLVTVHRWHLQVQMRDARKEVILTPPGTESGRMPWSNPLISPGTSPSEAAMRDERAEQLEAALGHLKANDREVLLLRHFQQLTNDEVADMLQLAPAAASRRYVRALARLRQSLDSPGEP